MAETQGLVYQAAGDHRTGDDGVAFRSVASRRLFLLFSVSTFLLLLVVLFGISGKMFLATSDNTSALISTTAAQHPPKLKTLARDEWKQCDEYTRDEIENLKAFEAFWVARLEEKDPLFESPWVTKNATHRGNPWGCAYYSYGLSGPRNGDKSALTDIFSGGCNSGTGFFECDYDLDIDLVLVDTWAVDFGIYADGDCDFGVNINDCDINCAVGSEVNLVLDVWSYEFSYNMWSSPSFKADVDLITITKEISVFFLETRFTNKNDCCFAYWDVEFAVGYDFSWWDDEFAIDLGTLTMPFLENYC